MHNAKVCYFIIRFILCCINLLNNHKCIKIVSLKILQFEVPVTGCKFFDVYKIGQKAF